MTAALAELDRWADDGGPVNDGGPGFAPLVVTLTPDTSRFWAEMTRAMTGLGLAIRSASDAASACLRTFTDQFDAGDGAYWAWRLPYERPVERARRLRVDRAMRLRARRAARHRRELR